MWTSPVRTHGPDNYRLRVDFIGARRVDSTSGDNLHVYVGSISGKRLKVVNLHLCIAKYMKISSVFELRILHGLCK